MKLPWKSKGIVLTAPFTKDVDDTIKFIDEYLAPNGCNLIVMQIRYRYQFKRHPECQGYDPLSESDIKKIVAVCKKNNIRLVPKINAVGHQSGLPNTPDDSILHGHHIEGTLDIRDGLLRAYPDFDEQPNEKSVKYSRSLCLTNPLVRIILFDLIDELLEVFEADAMHLGCDEVFNIGLCPECSKKSNAELFGNWINSICEHLKSRGAETLIWGDRFLNTYETGYSEFDASANGTDKCIDTVSKDIIMCDWHYQDLKSYPSVNVFGKKGFRMMLGLSHYSTENVKNFIQYAQEHDMGHIEGVLVTTWFAPGEISRFMLSGKEQNPKWHYRDESCEIIRLIFEQ